jgi:hypothetical protein
MLNNFYDCLDHDASDYYGVMANYAGPYGSLDIAPEKTLFLAVLIRAVFDLYHAKLTRFPYESLEEVRNDAAAWLFSDIPVEVPLSAAWCAALLGIPDWDRNRVEVIKAIKNKRSICAFIERYLTAEPVITELVLD